MAEAARIRIVRRGQLALVRKAYLPAEQFNAYRSATEGLLHYDRELRTRAATMERVPAIVSRLRRAGIDVAVDPELRTFLQKRKLVQWYELQAVVDRIKKLDDEVYARTGHHLFLHQCTGALWLTQRRTALLADEQGTGKSLTTIVALPSNAPTLIVVPASLKYEWLDELRKWRPQLRAAVLSGKNAFRWPREGEILIINYDVLPDVHDRAGVRGRRCDGYLPRQPCAGCKEELVFTPGGANLVRKGHLSECTGFVKDRIPCPGCHPMLDDVAPGTVLVGDELQKVKGGRSQRSIRYRAIADSVRRHDGRTWGLTGTPMENGPKELWYVSKACGIAEECFDDYKTFERLFNGRPIDVHGGYEWGMPDNEVVARIQRGALRRLRRDVLPNLPTKIHKEVTVDVDAAVSRKLDAFLRTFEGGLERLVSLIEQEKVPFEAISAVRSALATAKIPALLAMLSDVDPPSSGDDPIIVYSMHRAPIDAVGKIPGWETITGDVPPEKRRDIVRRFQAGQIRGLGVTIQAAGVGLTLTRAHRGIYVDLSYNPAEVMQSEDRMVRIGQTRGVIFTILKANHPLDQRVTEILLKKQRLISASVDAAASSEGVPIEQLKHDFEEDIRAAQIAIATGAAVRRAPETDEETAALEGLHLLLFRNPSDDRLAADLAEEAETIGLSDAQWALATRVAARGVERPKSVEEEKTSTENEKEESDGEGGEDLDEAESPVLDEPASIDDEGSEEEGDGMTDEAGMSKVDTALGEIKRLGPDERVLLLELLDDVLADPFYDVVSLVMGLSDAERETLEDRIEASFCGICGADEHRADACPIASADPIDGDSGTIDGDFDDDDCDEDEDGEDSE